MINDEFTGTSQESFWRGQFGDDYSSRNSGPLLISAKIDMFSKALRMSDNTNNILELGANIGLNASALKVLYPGAHYTGVEINETAFQVLSSNKDVDVAHHCSIYEFMDKQRFELVFTAGVLIHLEPSKLPSVYEKIYELSSRYILVAEYFSPQPDEVLYRGHSGKLFRRDFAGEILDTYTDLTLVDYGFVYRRDRKFNHDDMNWFLMEKAQR